MESLPLHCGAKRTMPFRTVLILVRENGRLLRRVEDPRSVRFQVRLLGLVLRDLEARQGGRRFWHWGAALLAVLLRDMGVVVAGCSAG